MRIRVLLTVLSLLALPACKDCCAYGGGDGQCCPPEGCSPPDKARSELVEDDDAGVTP